MELVGALDGIAQAALDARFATLDLDTREFASIRVEQNQVPGTDPVFASCGPGPAEYFGDCGELTSWLDGNDAFGRDARVGNRL